MRWQLGRRSDNVEDQRDSGMGNTGLGGSGLGGGMAVKGGGGVLILALIVYALGGDPSQILMQGLSSAGPAESRLSAEEQSQEMDFVSAVLGNTEDVWGHLLKSYRPPTLVVYSGAVQSACGRGQAATGPFYCPLDQKLYLDLEFFYDLEHALHAPGDFARAYVIAHEVGHHVQTLLGTGQRVQAAEQRARSAKEANALSVKLELQADCYAGVWAHHAQSEYHMLEAGDVDEALNAATQIGDDRLARQGGALVPDSFTHGTSRQRYGWFKRGFDGGDKEACDTFQ